MQKSNVVNTAKDNLARLCEDAESILGTITQAQCDALYPSRSIEIETPRNLPRGASPRIYPGQVIAHEGGGFSRFYIVLSGIVVRYNNITPGYSINDIDNEGNGAGCLEGWINRTYMLKNTKMFQVFGVGECVGAYEFVTKKDTWATSVFQRADTVLLGVSTDIFKKSSEPYSGFARVIRENLLYHAVNQWFLLQRTVQEHHAKYGRQPEQIEDARKYADSQYLLCNGLAKIAESYTYGATVLPPKLTLNMTEGEIAYYSGLNETTARNGYTALKKLGVIKGRTIRSDKKGKTDQDGKNQQGQSQDNDNQDNAYGVHDVYLDLLRERNDNLATWPLAKQGI